MLPPTQRAVKNAARIGSKTVAEFFKQMEEEGGGGAENRDPL